MKPVERLQALAPWLLGATFFILAGLAIQLSTVQLRSVTFVYGSEYVLDGDQAAFRVVTYDPLMNRTREDVSGSWSLKASGVPLSSGTLNGFGEFIIESPIPERAEDLELEILTDDAVLGTTTVRLALRSITEFEALQGSAALSTKHQSWAMSKTSDALLVKLYPLNSFEFMRGLPAPVIVEVLNENGEPVSNATVKLANCEQVLDLRGRALCSDLFTRSPALGISVEWEELTYRTELETSGHSQSLRMIQSDDSRYLELRTLPFRDVIHIDHWHGSALVKAMDIPRQHETYEWSPSWRQGTEPQFITAYRRILNPNSTATFYTRSGNLEPTSIDTALRDLHHFYQSLGERVIPLLGNNKAQNEAEVTALQTHLKARVARLMLLLGIAVIGWIVHYGYRARKTRKQRLQEWMLEADDDEFDPEVMKLGDTNHKLEIALGLAVLISFLFGLYVMLTELLRWGWELI